MVEMVGSMSAPHSTRVADTGSDRGAESAGVLNAVSENTEGHSRSRANLWTFTIAVSDETDATVHAGHYLPSGQK